MKNHQTIITAEAYLPDEIPPHERSIFLPAIQENLIAMEPYLTKKYPKADERKAAIRDTIRDVFLSIPDEEQEMSRHVQFASYDKYGRFGKGISPLPVEFDALLLAVSHLQPADRKIPFDDLNRSVVQLLRTLSQEQLEILRMSFRLRKSRDYCVRLFAPNKIRLAFTRMLSDCMAGKIHQDDENSMTNGGDFFQQPLARDVGTKFDLQPIESPGGVATYKTGEPGRQAAAVAEYLKKHQKN